MKMKFQASFLAWIQTVLLVQIAYLQRFLHYLRTKFRLIFLTSWILCFFTSASPWVLTTAKVIPAYKKDSNFDCNNEHLISFLPNIEKILEKLVYNRSTKFWNDNNLIYSLHFGYGQNYYSNHVLISGTEDIKKNLDKGKVEWGIFVDIQSVFDTLHLIIIFY